MILLTVLVLIWKLTLASDLFSSMSDMQKLYEHEAIVAENIEEYIQEMEAQLDTLDTFLNAYYQNHNYTEQDAEEYVSHPLNTFSLIKRTAMDLPKVYEKLFSNKSQEKIENMSKLINKYQITDEELEGAVRGLFLLTNTYKFNLVDFAQGKIKIPKAQAIERGLKPEEAFINDAQISTQEMHLIAKLAFNDNRLDWSLKYLNATLELTKIRNEPDLWKEVKVTYKTVAKKHDETLIKGKYKPDETTLFHKPVDAKLAKKKKWAKVKPHSVYDIPLFTRSITERDIRDLFEAACRDEPLRSPKYDISLTCQWLHYENPYLKLGPFKQELKSSTPFVAIFRDFMSDREVEAFKTVAEDKMERSKHSGNVKKNGGEGISDKRRTSKQIWLSDIDKDAIEHGYLYTPEARTVTNRITNATLMNSLSMIGGEHFQVANYGIGGQYGKHWDAIGEPHEQAPHFKHMGDRVQTVMVYLSDVEAGGATAFPMLGMAVWPKKGDAIAWYNLDRNGYQDKLMAHGGCPVIKGSKWITNKWLRWYPQSLNFPCTLELEPTRLEPLTNNICSFLPHCKKPTLDKGINIDHFRSYLAPQSHFQYQKHQMIALSL